MGFFDNDEYDNISPESLDGLAYDELNKRLHEYNQAIADEDEDVIQARKEKQKKEVHIFAAACIIIFGIAIGYFFYIYINYTELYVKNFGIRPKGKASDEDIIFLGFTVLAPAIPYILVAITIGIIAIFSYYFIKAKKNPKSIDDYLKINEIEDENLIRDGFTPQNFHPESFANPKQKPSPYISPNNYTSEIMVFLQSTDPTFNSLEFIEWGKRCFRIFWDAWTIGNMEAARIFVSDDLYNKMRSL